MIVLSGGGVTAVGAGNGWDVICPKCGKTTHVPYRIVDPKTGVQVDFVRSGGIVTGWRCSNAVGDVECGFEVAELQLAAS